MPKTPSNNLDKFGAVKREIFAVVFSGNPGKSINWKLL
jgi:hypothetical protein